MTVAVGVVGAGMMVAVIVGVVAVVVKEAEVVVELVGSGDFSCRQARTRTDFDRDWTETGSAHGGEGGTVSRLTLLLSASVASLLFLRVLGL